MSQANEAKSAAVEEVERLLQHSEDLKRLHTLCQDYDHKAQVGNCVRQLRQICGRGQQRLQQDDMLILALAPVIRMDTHIHHSQAMEISRHIAAAA